MQNALKDNNNRLAEAESTILLLKSLGSTASNGEDGKPGFLDALESLVDKLRKECESKYALKDDMLKFKKRIDALEDQLKYEIRDVNQSIENQGNSLHQCRDITDTNKLDIDDLKKMMSDLKKQLSGNASQTSLNQSDSKANIPTTSSKDLQDLLRRLKDLEE